MLALKAILESVEDRFSITFSYADENIIGIELVPPDPTLNLKNTLEYLSNATRLSFTPLDEQFVAIQKQVTEEQVICGYLRDSETGEPVVSASIQFGRSGVFITSDKEGLFRIVGSSRTTLTIQHLAYLPIQIEINATDDCPIIPLRAKVAELQEVFVSNMLVHGLNKNMDGGFQVNTQELQVLPGVSDPDILYIMQLLPGVQSPNESVSDINIRGGTNDQSLILWDGIKMYQSSHFFGLISAFNPYFTNQVNLTKNGSSARLGDGVSGTLDIQPGNTVDPDFSGGGGLNLLNADLYGTVPLTQRASLGFSARRSLADLVKTPTYNNYYDRAFRNTEVTALSPVDSMIGSDEEFLFYDLSAKLNYDLSSKDQLSISAINIFNDLKYQERESIAGMVESRTSSLTQRSQASSVNYARRWSPLFKTRFNAYTSFYQLRSVNQEVLLDQRLIQENEVLDIGIKADARLILHRTIDLFGGVQYVETGVTNLEDLNNPNFRRRIKEVVRSQIAFVEGNYADLSEKVNLRFGLRATRYLPFAKLVIEPRMAMLYQITGGLSLELLGEYKSQASTQIIDLQNDFLGVEKRRWVLANGDDIPIIRGKQASIGLQYDRNALLISLEGYLKEVDGIITSSQGFQNQFERIRSSGSYAIQGVDVLVSKQFGPFSSWLSYALAKNNYQFDQLLVMSFPNNLDILHNATLGSSYRNNHLQFSASINWHSGRPFTPVDMEDPLTGGAINYQVPNSQRLKPYFRVDLSGKYLFKIGEKINAETGFSIWNLGNSTNNLNTYYRIGDGSILEKVDQMGLNFTPNVLFRIRF